MEGAYPVIVIPHPSGGLARYGVGLFLLVWLGGWFVGLISVMGKVSAGEANPFLIFWLVGWTVGGGFAIYYAYRAFSPSIPESLTLKPGSVAYDSGMPPLQSFSSTAYTSRKDAWKSMFPKRTRVELDRRKLESLRLRETSDGNRLTVDVDATRLDIGQSASEIEREWLYQLLGNRYSLRPTESNRPA